MSRSGKQQFFDLILHTLRNPREAGARVVAMQIPPQVLWIAFGLGSVLMSLTASLLAHSVPLPEGETGDIIRHMPHYKTPLAFAVLSWIQGVVVVFLLCRLGQAFGGRGNLMDVMAVMIWLQIISLFLALSLFAVAMILPPLGAFAMLVAFFWGLWATVALVDAAHGFDNYFKAFFACLLAFLAVSLIGSILSGIIGYSA